MLRLLVQGSPKEREHPKVQITSKLMCACLEITLEAPGGRSSGHVPKRVPEVSTSYPSRAEVPAG